MSRNPDSSEDRRRGRYGRDVGQNSGANRLGQGQGATPDSQSGSRNAGGSQLIFGIGGVGTTTICGDGSTITVKVGTIRTTNSHPHKASESASSNFAGSQAVVGMGGIGDTEIQLTKSPATITIESIDNLPRREDI